MTMRVFGAITGAVAVTLVLAGVSIWWRFDNDIKLARLRSAQGSTLIDTRCGPIEVQQAGSGVPLLVVHGSGGGHDRGMALGGTLAQNGIRVIAMSRFGYLRTPMPSDASDAAQADAHVCLLDALGIPHAAVMGYSAGGPSAVQMAIRHADRVSALVLLMPLAYTPASRHNSADPMPAWAERTMVRLAESDFLVWVALNTARSRMIKFVLATPPQLLTAASPSEQARVYAMLDDILPVSTRAEGLAHDTAAAKRLIPVALASIHTPTLIVSARDDRYGTYASAQYSANRIAGAKFIGFDEGGHTWVGHNDVVMAAVVKLLVPPAKP